jgi:CubicO group peptidase (beta-lactamase class C family)
MTSSVAVREGRLVRGADQTADVPWWSFTKTVIAAAALALVRDGKLELDAALPGRDHSLRQLLQHRAGLRDYGMVPAYHEAVARREAAWPAKTMLERARADLPLHRPGEGWSYSNIGYYFVRRLIEETTGMGLDGALRSLVLGPLGIEHVRLASRRGELAPDYDPGWVYHGALIGPLPQAALVLDRLMAGKLLGATLTGAMLDRCPVPGDYPGRPWRAPGYGLGMMVGTVAGGASIAGHTGGGPGSVIAVYHDPISGRGTAAAFSPGDDQGLVEHVAAGLLI